jgi:predicted Rdx family selenoprotein
MQSLVIKQRFVDEIWWVLSSTIGLCLGMVAYLLLWWVSRDNLSTMSLALRSVAISFSMGGAIYAAVTGTCIIWLERRTIVKNRNQ